MRSSFFAVLTLAAITVSRSAHAQPPDPARDLAKRAYELKQQKRWEEARRTFEESLRLDPQPKHLINLADCEAELGKLVDARRHLVAAREATAQDAELNGIAIEHLAVVEKRMPRLTIRIAPTSPPGTVVARDGVTLSVPELNTALPTDPGNHVVVAAAQGRAERSFPIALVEGDAKDLEVAPGPVVVTAGGGDSSAGGGGGGGGGAGGSPWRTVGLVVMGSGGAGLVAGAILGLSAQSQRDDAGCTNSVCPNGPAADKLRDAKSTANLATVFFVAGGALVVGGAALWLLAPSGRAKSASRTVQVGIAPDRVLLRAAW